MRTKTSIGKTVLIAGGAKEATLIHYNSAATAKNAEAVAIRADLTTAGAMEKLLADAVGRRAFALLEDGPYGHRGHCALDSLPRDRGLVDDGPDDPRHWRLHHQVTAHWPGLPQRSGYLHSGDRHGAIKGRSDCELIGAKGVLRVQKMAGARC